MDLACVFKSKATQKFFSVLATSCALLLGGCESGPWNSPYPAAQTSEKVIYTVFLERPKHLDPARSYSSNEYEFIGNIYEPPLQYHYLKRPYVLDPLTVESIPTPEFFDAQGKRLSANAPSERIAYTEYEVRIKKGIKYQPHPAFAKDPSGRWHYQALTPVDLAKIYSLADFKHADTRELIAEDYVYQIRRLAHPRIHSPILSIMSTYIVGLKEYSTALNTHNETLKSRLELLRSLIQESEKFKSTATLDFLRTTLELRYRQQLQETMALGFTQAIEGSARARLALDKTNLLVAELKRYPLGSLAVSKLLPQLRDELTKVETQFQDLDLNRFALSGVRIVDRYTYRIRVHKQYPQLLYWMAMPFFAPVPFEADRFYNQKGMKEKNISLNWYPVGTGAYYLTKNDPNSKMIMQRNPHFRGMAYPAEGEAADRERGLLRDAGQRMPFVDKIVYSLDKESIPVWNKFLQGYYDAAGVNSDSFDQAVKIDTVGDARLTDEMEQKGIRLLTTLKPSLYYLGFNMRDPVVGGLTEQARKLRRALSIALDQEEYITVFLNGRGEAAQGPLPPGIYGYETDQPGINPYVYDWVDGKARRKSIAEAKRLLSEAGYPNGRNAQTGDPLTLFLDVTGGGADDRPTMEWYKKQLKKIDVPLEIRQTDYNRFQDKMASGKAQLYLWGWNADYPDPENFLFLLYGPNGKVEHHGENASNYNSPEFNALFKQLETMPNGLKRLQLIRQAVEVLRRDAPWIWGINPKNFILHHGWYKNAKPHSMAHNSLMYRKVDPDARREKREQWNQPYWQPLMWIMLGLVLSALLAVRVYQRRQTAAQKLPSADEPH